MLVFISWTVQTRGDMARAVFDIVLPDAAWVGRVSRQFREVEFRLLAGIRVDDGAIELGEFLIRRTDRGGRDDDRRAADVDAIATAIRDDPAVFDFELLHASSDRALAQYRTVDTHLYDLSAAARVAPSFPVSVRAGRVVHEVNLPRARLDDMTVALETAGYDYGVRSISPTDDASSLLTPRQYEAVETALDHGYYDTPRRASLTDVSGAMGVDKSTLSDLLHRAEERLVKSLVPGPPGDDGGVVEQ
jgi:predicted DNA binding protein